MEPKSGGFVLKADPSVRVTHRAHKMSKSRWVDWEGALTVLLLQVLQCCQPGSVKYQGLLMGAGSSNGGHTT